MNLISYLILRHKNLNDYILLMNIFHLDQIYNLPLNIFYIFLHMVILFLLFLFHLYKKAMMYIYLLFLTRFPNLFGLLLGFLNFSYPTLKKNFVKELI